MEYLNQNLTTWTLEVPYSLTKIPVTSTGYGRSKVRSSFPNFRILEFLSFKCLEEEPRNIFCWGQLLLETHRFRGK